MGHVIVILLGISLVSAVIYYIAYRIFDDSREQLAKLENDLHVKATYQEVLKKTDILYARKGWADAVANWAFWTTFIGLMICVALFVFWYIWWS